MTHPRGAVVVADDPFGRTPRRPYLVVSDSRHPFAGTQYLALGITTADYQAALPIRGRLTEGMLTREADSRIAPWAIVSLKAETISKRIAAIEPSLTNDAAREASGYLGLER